MKTFKKLIKFGIIFGIICGISISIFAFYFVKETIKDLPDYEQLRNYQPNITSRLYSADGLMISEYAKEKRVFIPIEMMPQNLKNAFIAAEDSNFYQNSGIDILAIFRAAITNAISIFSRSNERLGGASTITQQVAKNFLLTNQRTIERKIREAALAIKMTKTFSKDKILELYLNQIYLGSGAYGVAAAAESYFNKPITELEIEEIALLATLPKAPSKLDPRKNLPKALIRRNWVIDRMAKEEFITKQEAEIAKEKPIILAENSVFSKDTAQANFFSDAVKNELAELYGFDDVFESGIVVRTTLDSKLQKLANESFTKGIEDYDKRHGYRGALANFEIKKIEEDELVKKLQNFEIKEFYKPYWLRAVVLKVDKDEVEIFLENAGHGKIELEDFKWARKQININALDRVIKKASDVFNVGDVILVEKISGDEIIFESLKENSQEILPLYSLKQIPEVNGAMIAIDPHTGRVLAMMGGFVDAQNQFNRAIQAKRQPGSTMKPFGYLAALENGLTPASIIMDEPITLDQGDDLPPYNPTNYSGEFYGPTTLRTGLEKSRNVTTVRMVDQIGIDKLVEVVKRLGINNDPQHIYSLVLGSTETNLIKLVRAYSAIINGGKEIDPSMIEKIQDRDGSTIYRREKVSCDECQIDFMAKEIEVSLPFIRDSRKTLIDEATAYQMTYMLQGVVERGTAWKAREVGKILGGKTGTTNNSYDSWFVGFSPDLIVGVYVGYDIPKNLGNYETGSSVAMPIFIDFMKEALKDKSSIPFRVPSSIKLVKIDLENGKYPDLNTPKSNIFFEAFKVQDDVDEILSKKDAAGKIGDFFGFGSKNEEKSDDEQDEEFEPSGIY